MNREKILSILDDLIVDKNLTDSFEITDITTNLNGSNNNQVVFYQITEPKKSVTLFKKRFSEADNPLLVINKKPDLNIKNYIIIESNNFLLAQKRILDLLFPVARDKLKIIGVTGTNGKSSVVHLGMQISSLMRKKAICIGTLGAYDIDKTVIDTFGVTSPSYVDLRKTLNVINDSHQAVFIEVSSHSLAQKRLYDIKLDLTAWTSFSQDHLDYHKNMKEYFLSKSLIYSHAQKKNTSIYVPSSEKKLLKKIESDLSKNNPSSITLKKSIELSGFKELAFPNDFQTGFMKTNLELALSLNFELWGKIEKINIKKISSPKGRFSKIEINEAIIIIDYAHTPDAIENIVNAARIQYPNKFIKLLFGCGGDRDRSKREIMGKVAAHCADELIITSDNPRTENPMKIIEDILKGVDESSNFEVIENRRDAIVESVKKLKSNDILILAGKGHENYQDINGEKKSFDEFKIVKSLK